MTTFMILYARVIIMYTLLFLFLSATFAANWVIINKTTLDKQELLKHFIVLLLEVPLFSLNKPIKHKPST